MMKMKWHGAVMAVILSTRFYNLSLPSYVCWDETHFGKMAGLYINRTYFVDVHPPLGKMLIALAGIITGYDGKFAFTTPGDEYDTQNDATNYYGMRAFNAILGSMVIPLLYSTVKILTESNTAAIMTSCLLIFDCGLITLSQYILLDPILLFFISVTLFCTAKHSSTSFTHKLPKTLFFPFDDNSSLPKPFSSLWWFYLIFSGVGLGCVVAVKLVGVFTVIFVGCWTLYNLKTIWISSKENPIKNLIKHFLARVVCLIIVPVLIYVAVFKVHYFILYKSGHADGLHTSLFQTCLKGNPLYNTSMPLHVGYGSVISLKHHRLSTSGLLHSHQTNFPLEVMPFPHQQVTLYHHRDVRNFWQVVKPVESTYSHAGEEQTQDKKVEFLVDESIVRLQHVRTKHFLHSHERPAPLTTDQQIVSAHNYSNQEGKLNELWKIQIVNEKDYTPTSSDVTSKDKDTGFLLYRNRISAEFSGDGDRIRVITTKFWLKHVNNGCFLQSTFKVLPEWAEGRYEVTCSNHPKGDALWNVEQHANRRLKEEIIPPCQISFWERFVETHLAMVSFNSEMKGDEGEKVSRPWHWPLNYQGQVFTRMGEDDHRVYLLGNPLIFWVNLVVIFMATFFTLYQIFDERKTKHAKTKNKIFLPRGSAKNSTFILRSRHFLACKLFLFGWFIHYAPFFFMSRVLYFHHYYPAFLFSSCLSGCFLDLIFRSFSLHLTLLLRGRFFTFSRLHRGLLFMFIFCLMTSFYLYSPLCYGMTGPFSDNRKSIMYGLNFFDNWEI